MRFRYVSYLTDLGLMGAHPRIRFLHACLERTVQALNLHLVKRGVVVFNRLLFVGYHFKI